MSLCSFSVYLLVAMGAVFSPEIGARHISDDLRHSQDFVADALKLKDAEIGKAPLFSSVMNTINNSCQRKEDLQLLNATLDVYMRIFSSIQQHSRTGTGGLLDHLTAHKRSEVEKSLTKLQREMERLKNQISRLNHNKEDVLAKLKGLQVDDHMVQKKALAEFPKMYELAAVISHRC